MVQPGGAAQAAFGAEAGGDEAGCGSGRDHQWCPELRDLVVEPGQRREAAAEHDHVGIEQVDDAGEGCGEAAPVARERLQRDRVAVGGEAQLLADHIRQQHPRSLLAALCPTPALAAAADFPWELPTSALPSHLHEALHHAQCFSELTVGPQHLYNVLLARDAKHEFGWDTEALEAQELEHLQEWASLVADRHAELRAWAGDPKSFWAFLPNSDTVPERTKRFVETIVTRAVTEPAGFATDAPLHAQIREREIQLKTKRARLGHRSALESWNQAPFGGQLNYRWPITKVYLADMALGVQQGS